MRKLILLVSCVSACGKSALPTAPSIPSANIIATSNLQLDRCVNFSCSDFHFNVTNNGPGCASTTDLAGTVTLTKEGGAVSTASWTLTLGEQASGIFRPGQTKTAARASGSLNDSGGNGNYTITITRQTNVACP